MKLAIVTAAASLLMFGSALAEEKIEVKPGTAPTEAVGEAVPTMKNKCPDSAGVDAKAPGTEATEATGAAVPDMKTADAADCPTASTDPAKPAEPKVN